MPIIHQHRFTQIDFDELAARVSIRDILEDAGYEPKGNRMACPIHEGTNRTSFSFSELGFTCFSCGAKGGLLDLIEVLHGCSRSDAMRRLCRLAGSPDIGGCTYDGPHRIRQRPKVPRYSAAKIAARSKYEDLKLLRDALDCCLRILRRNVRSGKIDLASFYTREQECLYLLEETDAPIMVAICELHKIEKGQVTI